MRAALLSITVVLAWCALVPAADDGAIPTQPPPKMEKSKKKPSKPAVRISPQEEAAARDFAREHHPELLQILDHLEKNRANEYGHAINDLHRTAARLAQLQARDAARHELELRAWKLRSRIQLLAARLRLEPDDEKLHESLREAMLEQADLEIAVCEAERDRQAERLKQIDEQLRRLRAEREKRVDKQIEVLVRSKKRIEPKDKADHPAVKNPGDKM